MTKYSILDLAPVREGSDVRETFQDSLELAQLAEAEGYERFWLAEHHNMVGIGSAATSVIIGHIAAGTQRIRVGSGGVMLPNHSPLVIAEQFGTLEALFPKRIDLGVGRAPGTDGLTLRALRRDPRAANSFPDDVRELIHYLGPAQPGQRVVATPGEGSNVPVWILGSSTFGARLAAEYGLPYSFASHFAPAQMREALQIYRSHFKPSGYLERPYVMVAANVAVAETTEEARFHFSTAIQAFVRITQNERGKMPPPIHNVEEVHGAMVQIMKDSTLKYAFVGTPYEVRTGLDYFVRETNADEVIFVDYIFDQKKRLESYRLLAEVMRSL